jgi:hypothetical protein
MDMTKMTKGVLATLVGLAMIGGGLFLTRWGVKTIHEELQIRGQGKATATDTVRKSSLDEPVKIASAREVGIWTFTHHARDGHVLAKWQEHNTLSKVADQRMLENYYRGGSAAGASFYIGLVDSTTPCSITKSDTFAALVAYGEPSGNGYARVAVSKDGTGWVTSAASGNDWHIVSKVVTFTSTGTIGPVYCAFLSDAASGSASDWHAWVALSTARTLANGESLDVSMDITLQ